jgi:hypothetical protein
MLSRDVAQRPKDLRPVFEVLRAHGTVSAPAFAEPSLAVATGERLELPVDAHAATLPDRSPSPAMPSWQGQSVPSQAREPAARARSRVALAIGLTTVGLVGYLLSRVSSVSTMAMPSANGIAAAPPAPAKEPLPAPHVEPLAARVAAPTPVPQPAATPRTPVRPPPIRPTAEASTGVASLKGPRHPTLEDEDGTSDRK